MYSEVQPKPLKRHFMKQSMDNLSHGPREGGFKKISKRHFLKGIENSFHEIIHKV